MALKRNEQVWLGSDTRITDGDYGIDYQVSEHEDFHHSLEMDSKLILLDHAIIGCSGDVTMRNYLELFVSRSKNKALPFDHKLHVIEFFIAFKKFLKKEAGLGDSGSNEVQGMHNTAWLVATTERIFTVDYDGAVLEHPEMCVVGSGTYTARAILEYMLEYQPTLAPSKMLGRAHEIAVRHNLTCGGSQILVNVTKALQAVETDV
jgi:ATP-dependent protease HslVU (ClpYQ) peptidase subunit